MSNKNLFIGDLKSGFNADPDKSVFDTIFKEYERVVIESLIASFGLDFIVKDQYGGDVDTINNVRKIDSDPLMKYKNTENQRAYETKPEYDKGKYHQDTYFRNVKRDARQNFDNHGTKVEDGYIKDKTITPRNYKSLSQQEKAQLDHIIPAHKIHDDRGRILTQGSGEDSNVKGSQLANNPDNLTFTNASLNRNKSDMTVEEYIAWAEANPDKVNYNGKKGEPLPESVKEEMRLKEAQAQKTYDQMLMREYYTSPRFMKDLGMAAGKRGAQMALRQALGFVLAELFFSAKEEIGKIPEKCGLKGLLDALARGVANGMKRAKQKYKVLISRIEEGFVAGCLSSLTTSITNIFFTTSKNFARCSRQIYASITQAAKVLLCNPDNLYFGDRLEKTSVILATGASVLVGISVQELVAKTPLGAAPTIGPILQTFCSTMVSGLLSCSFLIFLDRSKMMNQIITNLNNMSADCHSYEEMADAFDRLVAEYNGYSIEQFREETVTFNHLADSIDSCESDEELNVILLNAYKTMKIDLPWQGDFDLFMSNKKNKLVFK